MNRQLGAWLIAGALAVPGLARAQQPLTVSGQVTATSGEALPQVQVSIASLQVGALTRDDGRYTFVVPGAQASGQTVTITARRLGYEPKSATIVLRGTAVTQDFALTASATQLTGVVVSALGLQREKANIGFSQQEVSSEDLTRTRDPNLVNNLSGKVSGVQISGGGTIGGSSRILIRGATSVTGNNQPLFVVDGIPVDNSNVTNTNQMLGYGGFDYGNAISDLNPADIASITVLKGPNAAALYGSRAANGAVVITTKTAKGTRGISITASNYTTFDTYSRLPDYQNRYGQGSGGAFSFVDGAGGGTNDGLDESWGPPLDGQLIDQFTGPQQPWVPAPDNVKNFFQTGYTTITNAALNAGGENASARIAFSDEQVKGIVPNSALGKISASVNGSVKAGDRFTATGDLQYVQSRGMNRPGTGYNVGILEQFIWFGRQVNTNALRNYYDENGNLYNWNYNYHNNPYWLQYENPNRDSRDRIIGVASANYQFAPWLSGLVRLGTDTYRENRDLNFAKGNLNFASPQYSGAFSFYDRRRSETTTEALLNANGSLGSRLELRSTLGASANRRRISSDQVSTSGISVPGTYNVSNAAITPTVTNGVSNRGTNSVYGSVSATLNKYWTVEVTGRNDWSSTLPEANNSYFYPSVNSSLILTDLVPALRNGVLDYLKVRGGWAQVGNDADPYQLLSTYSGLSNKFGPQPQFTLSNSLANPNLKPEQTTGMEGGVELALLDNRITLDATYYVQWTDNQIINLAIAPASGFSGKVINAGRMENRGVEALLTVVPVRSANFQWTSTFNFARNRNKVVSLYPGLDTYVLGTFWSASLEARVGQPYGAIVGAPYLRDSATGQLILSDGLPQADRANRRVLGNVNPDWTGGWGNDLRYKNVSLSFLIDIRQGGDIFSAGNMFGNYTGVFANTLQGRENGPDDPGILLQGIDEATGEANTTRVAAEDYYESLYGIHEQWVQDAGFVKLRELRLGLNVPQSFTRRLRLANMTLALVGRNLWMSTDLPNIDPETALSAGNIQGFEFASLPTTRSIGFNITVTP